MRIALVHSFYRSDAPSGENTAVVDQAEALTEAGHDVLVVARHTDVERTRSLYRLRAGWHVATGTGADPSPDLRAFRPDVVHVHNLFPNFATGWLAQWPGALVATAHNFRPMCASYALARDGHPCTLCPDRGSIHAVVHACYRQSRVATVPLAIRNRRGVTADPVISRSDRLIVIGRHQAEIYARYGVDPAKTRIVRNGLAPIPRDGSGESDRWILHGRLSQEKGVESLLAAWPQGEPLDLYGDGPLRPRPECPATWHGSIPVPEIRARLSGHVGGVFAGFGVEGFPVSVAECLAAGLPVVVRAGTTTAEFLEKSGCGISFTDAASLASALREVRARRAELSRAAVAAYDAHFGQAAWVEALVEVYAEAMAEAASDPRRCQPWERQS